MSKILFLLTFSSNYHFLFLECKWLCPLFYSRSYKQIYYIHLCIIPPLKSSEISFIIELGDILALSYVIEW